MTTKALGITATNLLARGAQLVLFVLIGNRYGAGEESDLVFFCPHR